MKPARRKSGSRPRARSSAERQAAIWSAIRAVRADALFSAPGLAKQLDIPRNTVNQYLAALARGGFIAQVEPPSATQAGAIPALWRRKSRHTEAPLVTWSTRTARPQGVPTP